ncbi:MAG: radical protein [Planctomycetaceae bacterium]|nr:radical protein [Planctomycetaceae bacterium]
MEIITDSEILATRPAKNVVDPWRPYAYLTEPERTVAGQIEQVATLFLTNRECPFRCLMCDLWKNTLDERVPLGAIPAQIDYALARMPAAQHIKLYNSANFFDPQAIPREDWPAIAGRVRDFRTIIVENHPRLCGSDCLRFRDLIETSLEVALGLETIHSEVLERLNKRMTLHDFDSAVEFLTRNEISVRTFLLLRPPYQTESEGIEWACRGIEYAFDRGVGCVSVIPVRGGNGIMERLAQEGLFQPPSLSALETVLEFGLNQGRGRVFVDLWDLEKFDLCSKCGPLRRGRLQRMNLSQQIEPNVTCDCAINRDN